MATDYNEFADLAKELILENGREVKIQLLDATPADPTKPWKGPAAPVVAAERTLAAVFVPASGGGLGKDIVNDEMLARVEQVALIAPSDIPLHDFDVILDEGVRWSIDWAQELRPGPLTVLYVFGVKR